MAKKKEPTDGEVMAKEIIAKYKTKTVADIDGRSKRAYGRSKGDISPKVIVQRCIVHLIRNSIKYIPSKDYKAFTANLKKIYGTPSLKAAQNEFDKFKQTWNAYPGAVEVWARNFEYVAQLFDYGGSIQKIMYTTNAVESVNSSFRKVTKQGAFPNENALLKLLYLRITKLYRKWDKGTGIQNWVMVRNRLSVNPKETGKNFV